MKRTALACCVIAFLVLVLVLPGPRPAHAFKSGDAAAAAILSSAVVGGAVLGYIAWINRPNNPNRPSWEVRGPGGFFVGGFLGASLAPSTNWSHRLEPQGGLAFSASDISMSYQASVTGGLKGGYFFHKFPYFGIEAEFNYSSHAVRNRTVAVNPAIFGASTLTAPGTRLYAATLALHLLGRYGFLPDKEVPFGRLQPYAGIGPGFVIIFGPDDSAKNFSLEALAGVRYMLLKNLSMFVEYKFSQQWDVELSPHRLDHPLLTLQIPDKATFDFITHKIVVGFCFHFR